MLSISIKVKVRLFYFWLFCCLWLSKLFSEEELLEEKELFLFSKYCIFLLLQMLTLAGCSVLPCWAGTQVWPQADTPRGAGWGSLVLGAVGGGVALKSLTQQLCVYLKQVILRLIPFTLTDSISCIFFLTSHFSLHFFFLLVYFCSYLGSSEASGEKKPSDWKSCESVWFLLLSPRAA